MNAINRTIDNHKKELIELSLKIHHKPEIAYQEHYACTELISFLATHRFTVKSPISGIDTAFVAEYKALKPGPVIAYIAEYDALPEIGHACGHNLIAMSACGAALGLQSVIDSIGGTVRVVGTPAEEGGGGKIIMVNQGVFDDVDYAMMIHPATENLILRGGLATRNVTIEYWGKAAHSSTPEKGTNALNAVIQTFNLIDSSRALLPLQGNINGIIVKGGKAPNIITEHAICKFSIRAKNIDELTSMVNLVEDVVCSVDSLIGTTSKIVRGMVYAERYINQPMAVCMKNHMEKLGICMKQARPCKKLGSSDIGNVSIKIPVIHSYISIAGKEVNAHSTDFALASASVKAHDQMIAGAKGLAQTGHDILSSNDFQSMIKDYHQINTPNYTAEDLM